MADGCGGCSGRKTNGICIVDWAAQRGVSQRTQKVDVVRVCGGHNGCNGDCSVCGGCMQRSRCVGHSECV